MGSPTMQRTTRISVIAAVLFALGVLADVAGLVNFTTGKVLPDLIGPSTAAATRSAGPSRTPPEVGPATPPRATSVNEELPSPPGTAPYLLSSSTAVDSSGVTIENGPATVGQRSYMDSVSVCTEVQSNAVIRCGRYVRQPVWAEYVVPAGYGKLDVWVGFSSESSSNCNAVVQVLRQDGTRMFKEQIRIGDPPRHVVGDLQVTGRLRLQLSSLTGGRCAAVFGNATFVP